MVLEYHLELGSSPNQWLQQKLVESERNYFKFALSEGLWNYN
jgi:hypothetical protein